MSPDDILTIVVLGIIGTVTVVTVSVAGWIYTTRQKIKHGYPLESMWGRPLHPQSNNASKERIELLTQENSQLRAELGSLHERLGNVERIVTDSGYRLGHEIERLREEKGKVQ